MLTTILADNPNFPIWTWRQRGQDKGPITKGSAGKSATNWNLCHRIRWLLAVTDDCLVGWLQQKWSFFFLWKRFLLVSFRWRSNFVFPQNPFLSTVVPICEQCNQKRLWSKLHGVGLGMLGYQKKSSNNSKTAKLTAENGWWLMVESNGGELDWKGMCNEKALLEISAVCSSFWQWKCSNDGQHINIALLRNSLSFSIKIISLYVAT